MELPVIVSAKHKLLPLNHGPSPAQTYIEILVGIKGAFGWAYPSHKLKYWYPWEDYMKVAMMHKLDLSSNDFDSHNAELTQLSQRNSRGKRKEDNPNACFHGSAGLPPQPPQEHLCDQFVVQISRERARRNHEPPACLNHFKHSPSAPPIVWLLEFFIIFGNHFEKFLLESST